MFKIRKALWLVVLALALVVTLFAPDSHAAGSRLVATLDEPFEVDGQLYPAGKLSLREVREYSPVATLNEVRIDGRSLGVLLAQEVHDPTPATRDELIFVRDARGHLVLASIAVKGEPVRRLSCVGEHASMRYAASPEGQRSLLASTK